MDIGQKLRNARRERKLSQKELGDLIGTSSVSIGKWERGVGTPALSSLIKLSSILGIPLDELSDEPRSNLISLGTKLDPNEHDLIVNVRKLCPEDRNVVFRVADALAARLDDRVMDTERPSAPSRPNVRKIAVYLSPAAAGISAPIEGSEFEMVEADGSLPAGADIGIRIQGDSMEPYIDDGSVVYVSKTQEILEGDVGIFCVDGSMYCKQFHREPNGTVMLLSANPERAMSNVVLLPDSSSTLTVVGKVLMHRIPLPDYF